MKTIPIEMREHSMDVMTKGKRPAYMNNVAMNNDGRLYLCNCPVETLYLRIMHKHQNWCCEVDTVWDAPRNERFNIWRNMYTFYSDLKETTDKLYIYTKAQWDYLVAELDEKYEEDWYNGTIELNYRGGGDRYWSNPCLFEEIE